MNNTPFVRYKHFTDEGGISTPLIVHWPEGISKARNNQLEPQPGHLVDIMATCLDVAGASYPTVFNGKPIRPPEGVSLRPAFEGKDLMRKQPIFWEHEGNRAIREGQWKLVALEKKPWRLYDLAADRTEQRDLAETEPERVLALSAKWDAWAARANVLPLGGWRAPATGEKTALTKETRFELKGGDHLGREQAPPVAGRGFSINAKFSSNAPAGVLVAQGGSARGYSLFFDAGKVTFLYRTGTGKQMTRIAAERAIVGDHTVLARVEAGGTMTLALDGQNEAEGEAPALLTTMPTDGLDVGSDAGGLVGLYSEENKFNGIIESVLIELEKQ